MVDLNKNHQDQHLIFSRYFYPSSKLTNFLVRADPESEDEINRKLKICHYLSTDSNFIFASF